MSTPYEIDQTHTQEEENQGFWLSEPQPFVEQTRIHVTECKNATYSTEHVW